MGFTQHLNVLTLQSKSKIKLINGIFHWFGDTLIFRHKVGKPANTNEV